ncbi:TetR/AcrR family transcriptional regulator [Sporichthya brevicatena]|uniref:TetR/AcrR family transcriptional regulator n=1 Tax=Sporichthya brevicatena TaxID=171442 RepID=A0ABN1GCE3_9ACTN
MPVSARERVLEAVEGLIAEGGLRAVNIASVAAAAGVSRQTVYAQFGTREEMISESIAVMSSRALGEIIEHLESIEDPGEYVVELLVAGRAAFRDTPALAVLLFPDTDNPIFDSEVLAGAVPFAEAFVGPLFERAPHLQERRADVMETLLRFGLSVLTLDSDLIRTDEDLRGYLNRVLRPALGLSSV